MYVSASSGRKSAISRRRIFVVCQSKRRPKGAVTGSMPPARSTVRLRGCGRITTRCSTPARFSARQRRRKCRSATPCGAPARACSQRGIERRELLWTDRKSVVEGKSVAVRVDSGGRRLIKKKKKKKNNTTK